MINFKGGVSKTTLSFHLACFLSRDARVLLIDVDHQSSLSIVTLGAQLWQAQVDGGNTVNRVFESFTNRRIPMPGSEIIIRNALHSRDSRYNLFPNLDFVAAQFELDDTEIDLASTSFGQASQSDWEKRTLLASWLDNINAQAMYDYVIFDCPPATKIVSQNALSCSHCYLVPVIPDELSSRGVTHFAGLVTRKIDERLAYLRNDARIPDNHVPSNYEATTGMAAIVPSLVKSAGRAESGMTNIHTEQLATLRRRWQGSVLETIGKHYIGVPEAMNAGWPIWNYAGQNAKSGVKRMMTGICNELKQRIDAI
ncbi:ParA family protein [Sphingomonas ursincola]|uniref:ParA family protein n=1 Tax=Sphingomonas ursincola TaxID=56361 RepID=UPI0031DA9D09